MSKIPACTLSGGTLSGFGGEEAVKEYRIWYHPQKGGDDKYMSGQDLDKLIKRGKTLSKKNVGFIELPLAVVWDDKKGEYREVAIGRIKSRVKRISRE